MTMSPVREGEVLAGKYRVERVLGVGGMGVVVAATHLDLLELRALKFMLPTALDNAEAVERFLREARAVARLRSEHVAKVHDVGRLENGAPYMVMEYLAGADLGAILKQRGPLPAHEAALYTIQACSALAEAHAAGIIHRDLKPANLFLTHRPDGSPCVKVLDFGISKMGASGSELEMTKTHEVLGSPRYMSPEQMRSARNVDARSDVWSLGVILYKLMTGNAPFRGNNITELIGAVLEGAPPPPSQLRAGLPVALDAVTGRCLRRKPEERFQSVTELAAALTPFALKGAFAARDPVARLLASVTPGTPAQLDGVLTRATPAPSSIQVQQGGTITAAPASTSRTLGTLSPQSQRGEPTEASWGKTSSPRRGRPRLLLALAAVLGLSGVLALGLVVRVLVGKGASDGDTTAGIVAAPASAPVASVAATASLEAPPPPLPPEAPRAGSAAPVVSAAVAPSVPATWRSGGATPRGTFVPKAPASPGSDPFGRGRK